MSTAEQFPTTHTRPLESIAQNHQLGVAAARKACEVADDVTRRRRGDLIAMLAGNRSQLPPAIRSALEAFELAERLQSYARDQVHAAREGTTRHDPAETERRQFAARLSALVAHYVMESTLSITPEAHVHKWRVVDRHGKLREVPNYAGDMGAVAVAEDTLSDAECDRYGLALSQIVGDDAYDLACAPPLDRARALLLAVGVGEAAQPPIGVGKVGPGRGVAP